MNSSLAAAIVAVCLIAAAEVGMRLRRLLPQEHLGDDTKDTVRLATGLIATMSALLLGLLVSSAKGAYDSARAEVEQLASKCALLDRALEAYGPEAREVRKEFHDAVRHSVQQMWPKRLGAASRLAPNVHEGNLIYSAILKLTPMEEAETRLKQEALRLALEVAEVRVLLQAQSSPSISFTMLSIVVLWLVVIFLSFGLFSPSNTIASLALVVSAVSVAGAIFMLMELDSPFDGMLCIAPPPFFGNLAGS